MPNHKGKQSRKITKNHENKPGKSIKYNEQHSKKWNAMNISEEKTMNTLKLKQIKNIQQNNVNGWQNLENYRKSKKTQWTH